MNVVISVAAYKEDLSWLNKINNKYKIEVECKSDTINNLTINDNITVNYSPNVGREASTICRTIIKYIDAEDTILVHLQGQPWDGFGNDGLPSTPGRKCWMPSSSHTLNDDAINCINEWLESAVSYIRHNNNDICCAKTREVREKWKNGMNTIFEQWLHDEPIQYVDILSKHKFNYIQCAQFVHMPSSLVGHDRIRIKNRMVKMLNWLEDSNCHLTGVKIVGGSPVDHPKAVLFEHMWHLVLGMKKIKIINFKNVPLSPI